MLVELVQESIAEREKVKAAIEAELETLREIEGLAGKLNGGGTVPEPAAAPMRPRQHDATRAEVRTAAKKTSARRRPAPPRQESGTTSGAQAPAGGGRRHNYDAAEILEKARRAISGTFQSVTFSVSEITRELGYPDKNDRALAAVRQAVLDLLGEEFIAEAGKGRGGHPRYRLAGAEPTELVDRIVAALELDGGRMPRLDLRARMGDPEFDEFNSAIEILTNEGKISATRAGGVAAYELIR